MKELNMPQEVSTEIHIDNKSATVLAKNPVFHDRSKHIGTRYHFIRERAAKKEVQLKHTKPVLRTSQSLSSLRSSASCELYWELPIKFKGDVENKLDWGFKNDI